MLRPLEALEDDGNDDGERRGGDKKRIISVWFKMEYVFEE
jgi:hypothetical protein